MDESVTPNQDDSQIKNTENKPQKNKKTKKILLIIVGIVVLISLLVGAFLYGKSTQNSQTISTNGDKKAEKKAIVQEKIDTSDLGKFTKPTTGEVWYAEAKALPDQKYITSEYVEGVKYFEIGKRGKNLIVMAELNYGLGAEIQLFEKLPDGKVQYIAQPSSTTNYATELSAGENPSIHVESVSENTSLHYDSLSIPKSLAIGEGEEISTIDYPDLGVRLDQVPTEGKTSKVIKKIGESKIVRIESKYIDTGLTSIAYVVQLPIGTQVRMEYEPIPTNLTGYKWDNNIESDGTAAGIVRGCGSFGGLSRADNMSSKDFTKIGTSSNGQTLYGFADENSQILTKAYEEYVVYNQFDPEANVLSKKEFIDRHGIFVHKSKQGEWLVYTIDTLAPATGCAKPVVYLYPEKETEVKVKVGADVKISDPFYDPNHGWTALARPDGKLAVNSQTYDSLFWEGPGYGEYPVLTSGVIVKQSEALSTIKQHLAKQGLNKKESQDFVEYWQDKIPNKPYIRLTWLTNNQLDTLAPLVITPKPDTVHRVFLDMAGVDKPFVLKPQKLEKVTRKGFTVIEWGGLAQNKLYEQ